MTTSMSTSQILPSSPLKTSYSAKTISQTPMSPLREDCYFGVGVYASPEHSDDDDSDSDGRSDSTLEDASPMLFGYPLERMPRLSGVHWHSFQYKQDLNSLLLASRSSRSSSISDSVISTTSGASYDTM